jgi:hypothetical protein
MLREGETVGDYVSRLERRLAEIEPPEGFTIQEWHVGQVFTYLLWRPEHERDLPAWDGLLSSYEKRFPEQVKKFADYMGWKMKPKPEQK